MITCIYFDGKRSVPVPVSLTVSDGMARVTGDGIDRSEPLGRVHVSEKMGSAPRMISFGDGAYCEVRDHAALEALLRETGFREPLVPWLQRYWAAALVSAALCAGAAVWAYLQLLPWAAEAAAAHVPPSVVERLSDRTLSFLDEHVFEPSKLPQARQTELAQKFRRMTPPDGDRVAHRILFRDSGRLGPNAFALPSGSIVVTDALVELAERDEEILAVLAHELGHVQRRHGVRLALQSSVVGLVTAWYLGDLSSLATALPAALLEARYSRQLEQEADDYGARMLRFNSMTPALLADMLERLERSHRGTRSEDTSETPSDYLASHPATAERIRTLRSK